MSEIQQKNVRAQGGNGGAAVEKRVDPVAHIAKMLDGMKAQLAVALPRHLTPDRMSRVFLTTLRQTPKLALCEPASLFGAVFQAAQLGLEIGSGLGHAYLVPYGREATLIIGYKGLVDLARRSGQISNVYAVEVRKGDKFKYQLGTDPKIDHEPSDDASLDDRDISHVYAVAKMKDGSTQFEVMRRGEVEKIRNRSRASKDGPWVTDYSQMSRKTVLRRLCKMLPTSIELQVAIAIDEAPDANLSQVFDVEMAPDLTSQFAAMEQNQQLAAGTANPLTETNFDPKTGEALAQSQAEPGANDKP